MYRPNQGIQYPYGCYPQQMQGGYAQCPPGTVPPQQCPPQACVPVCYPVNQPCVWYGPAAPGWAYGCTHAPGQAHDKSCVKEASGGKGKKEEKKGKSRHRHTRGHKHVTCHKKGTESRGLSSSSCSSDSE
ncbi:uncharacterized protein ABDE67_012104 [Symphorus nematophorus]